MHKPYSHDPDTGVRLLDMKSPDASDLHRELIESVTDYAILVLDAKGHILSWNPGAARIKGFNAEEIVGRHFSCFYPPEDIESGKPFRVLQRAAEGGRLQDEGWRVRKDGSRFWASVVLTAIRNDHGELTGFVKITRNLSERREAEEKLRRSEERFRLLVQSIQDYAIFMIDPEGRVTSWNEGASRIKGYTAEEILGQSFTVFYPADARASGFPRHELESAARHGRFEDEGWRVRKDGSQFWANAVLTALRDNDGRLIGFAKVTRDLTARREAEAQAQRLVAEEAARAEAERRSEELVRLNDQLQQQAAELEAQASQLQEQAAELEAQTEELHALTEELRQKNDQLEAALSETRSARVSAEQAAAAATEAYRELDQFAYVASHDLKAPLRGIANLAQWIQEDAGERLAAESIEHLRLLQGRVRRMEALIDGILAYSRAGRVLGAPEPVDTGDLVREVLELLVVPDTATIEVPPMMPTVLAERVPLQQVFLNLIGNALKYTQAFRPDVVIRVAWRDVDDRFEFLISDNGPGIDPQYHERIWGVFQTLEARDKVEGTGIGLSVVKKIVESRGGSTSLESAPNRGATFGFTWPKTSKGGLLP